MLALKSYIFHESDISAYANLKVNIFISIMQELILLQIFAIELITNFFPLAVEFSAFAVEFVSFVEEFVALAIELDTFAMGLGVFSLELVTFALEFIIARLTSWSKHENKM